MAMESGEVTEERDGWWWTVPKAKAKNARHANATDFRVPLVGRALDVVRRRMDVHGDFLFPSPGELGHVEQKTIQAAVHYHRPYSKTRPEHARPRLLVSRCEWLLPQAARRSYRP